MPAVLLIPVGESIIIMIPEYDRSFHSCVLYLSSHAIPHIHVFDIFHGRQFEFCHEALTSTLQ